MAQACINPDPIRRSLGYAQPMVDALTRVFGKKPTTEQARNVLRNIGIDDQRALDIKYQTKGGNERRFFGKNIKDIEQWTSSKGSVPSQTIVKKTMPDGRVRYYMSRQKTDLAPTRWVETDGRIRSNPDWDSVGENATFQDGIPQQFVRLKDGTYRVAQEGEDGVYLNIQNPHRGERLSRDQILDMEVDAYDLGGGRFRLIDENTQAIEPDKAGLRQSRDAFHKSTQENTPTDRELSELAEEAGIGRPLGYTLGGGMLGAALQDDGTEGAWLGAGLGMMLGSRRVRNRVKGYYSGKKSKDLDQQALEIDELERTQRENQNLVDEGYAGRLDDEVEKTAFRNNVLEPLRRLRQAGEGVGRLLTNNKYFGSGYSVFQVSGSETAKQTFRTMEGAQSAANAMYGTYSENLIKQFGDRGWREARTQQVNTIRQITGDDSITEERALELFGESMFRTITYRANVDDGRFVFDSKLRGAEKTYENAEILASDEAILRTEAGQRMKEALQDTFNGIADQQIKALDTQINRLITVGPEQTAYGGAFDGVARADIKSFVDQKLSFKQWHESLGDLRLKERIARYRQTNSPFSDEFNQVIEWHNRKASIQEMRGSYFPQIFSNQKAARDYTEFIKNRGLQEASLQERNMAYWQARSMNMAEMDHNAGRLLKPSDDGMDVVTDPFATYSEAAQKLRSLTKNISDDEIRNQVIRDLDSGIPERMDRYVGEEMIDGQRKYFVQNPESFAEQGINIMNDLNYEHFLQAQSLFMAGTRVKKSNHLDRARRTIMPAHMIETDIDKVIRHYSNDVAPRLHFMNNNLASEMDLNNMFRSIRNEVGNRIPSKELEQKFLRMRTWWNISQNGEDYIAIGRTPREQALHLENMSSVQKLLQGVSNFAIGGFMYFTGFYAVAQPLLMAPFYGTWKQTKGAYRQIFDDPLTLRRVTDEFEKMNIFDKTKKGSYNVMAEQGMHPDRLPGSDASRLDSFYNFSQKLVDFGMDFSLTKHALKNSSIDLERGGLLRVVGGNLMDVSSAEAGITTLAVLRHVEDLVDAGRRLGQSGQGQVDINGRIYRDGDIRRQLEDLGVQNVDRFIESKEKFNAYVRQLEGSDTRMRDAFDNEQEYLEFYDQVTRIMNTTVDQYHGRSVHSRPEAWVDNPYGRALARFSSYAQNFGIRVVRQRMYQPLKDWTTQYQIGEVDNHSLFKIAYHMSNNNESQLRQIFGSKRAFDGVQSNKELAENFYNSGQRRDRFVEGLTETEQERWFTAMDEGSFKSFTEAHDQYISAYNDFPVQAVHNLFKTLPALGVGKAMLMTRAAVVDLLGIATNEALGNDDYDAWRALNRQWVINPQSNETDQKTFGELFDDSVTGYDLFQLFKHGLYLGTDLGFAGRIGALPFEESRYPGSGLASKTPVTGMLDDAWQMFGEIASQDSWSDLVETAPRQLTDQVLLRTPPIGSFADHRRGLINAAFNQPQNRNAGNYTEFSTGERITDIQYVD